MSSGEEYKFTDADVDNFMSVATKLIKEAGEMISKAIGDQDKAVNYKDEDCKEGNASSVLTETDTAVEKHLTAGLLAAFPDHKFIGEEDISAGSTGLVQEFSNNPTWIIDPIDGTMNFVHRNPLCCTSMGLAINRRIVLGLVNNPMTGHLYTAIKGRGAFLEGSDKPLKTSGVQNLKKAMILCELPVGANEEKKSVAKQNVANLMDKAHAIRCPGPAALDISWIGAGSADGFYHAGIHCWDMVAGALITVEAGGCVTSLNGGEFDFMDRGIIAAASPQLAEEIKDLIKIYKTKDRDFEDVCPL